VIGGCNPMWLAEIVSAIPSLTVGVQ
jgi:hypothetical protein